MAASVISISSDSSNESVGSSPQVNLIGYVPIEVPVTPEVAAVVASPAGVPKLDTHSLSDPDPSESSLPPVPVAPMVSPFLHLDDSESDTELPERHVSFAPHDAMLARWRSRVASRPSSPSGSSSPTTSTLEIHTAPILPAPSTDIISPDIPIGRLYLTYPGGPCRDLTARKLVRPLTSHRLAPRYKSHHLDRFTSGSSDDSSSDYSSLDHSSSDHSSSGHSTSEHSSSGHSTSDHSSSRHPPPVTTIADSSTPSRFVDPPLDRTSRYSEAYCRWRSPIAIVTLPIPASGALVLTHADLLPPRKRFRDSISPDDSIGEEVDAYVLADIEVDIAAKEAATGMDVEVGIDAGIGIEADVEVDREVEAEASAASTREIIVDPQATAISEPTREYYPDMVSADETRERQLEADRLIASGERAGFLYHFTSLRRSNVRLRGTLRMESVRANRIKELVNQRVEEALAAYKENDAANALEAESQSQNSSDGDNGNGGNGNGRNGNGNGNRRRNRNGNHNGNDRGVMPVARECTYQDFIKCQPLNFKGTKGVVGLTRWFEKMETMFHISNCLEKYKVKYATCTLLNSALSWWNSYKRTIRIDAAYAMSWRELMKLMAEVYCPRNEIQKMETEL
ncbi:hypothetical protein Tco_0238375 [Tanacetum coccineum]